MYENNYPNNTYHYDTGNMGGMQTPKGAEPKKGMGIGKKIAVAVCSGLCFGIFAGMGFLAVNTAGNLLGERLGGCAGNCGSEK